MTDRIVYTAIYGGYDRLTPVRRQFAGVRWLCFTDDPNALQGEHDWNLIHRPPEFGEPRVDAKFCKVMAHRLLGSGAVESLWIDANRMIRSDSLGFEFLRDGLGLNKHPRRKCLYHEATHCLRQGIGDPDRISSAIRQYSAEGFPPNAGLYDGGVIWRRHTPEVSAFNEAWWGAILAGSLRDQISLPVVLRRLELPFTVMARSILRLQIQRHRHTHGRSVARP